ncbi:MAG TPA: LysR family transcriptional regulator [Ktedonobacteraceae bacterium]|nr:LysR family transcriptional regulator [Ktedonobacteraceae bacterium]
MNLQNLRVFLKVAEFEHITRASEELGLSQPAVTKTISSLENEIHLKLVERQGRRIVLTHAGRVLQGYARQIFALEREMEDALATLRNGDGGEVTLAANTTIGVYLLPPIVARFQARFPKVKLNIAILNSQETVEGTLNWSLDFGLVEGDVASLPPLLTVQPFAHDELILVVAPNHYWSRRSVIHPEMLVDGVLLLREPGSGIREVIENRLQLHDVHIRPVLTLPNNEAIKQMVMNGVGAAIISSITVQRELAQGSLVRVPLPELDLRPQLSLIMRKDKQLSRAAQAFCSFLLSGCSQTTEPLDR